MERTYSVWVAVSVATIILVVALFYVSLRSNKQKNGTTPSPSVSTSVEPSSSTSPESSPSSSTSSSSSPEATNHREQGDAAYRAKDYQRAIAEYTLAIQQTSNPKDVAYLWNQIGNAYRDNQQSNEALTSYDKAITNDSKLGAAYLNKAAILWSQGKKDAAKDVLRAGLTNGATPKQDLQNTLDVYEVMSQ